jgi:hypothetical protein
MHVANPFSNFCPKILGPTALSIGKQMAAVFWDMEDILMVEWLPLFDKMKDPLRGSRFPNNHDLQSGVRESVRTIP